MALTTSILLLTATLTATAPAPPPPAERWQVLAPEWDADHPLDLLSIEWEYFMVHDRLGRFVGMVGYVLTNPRDRASDLAAVIPAGGNVALGGRFDGGPALGEFVHFTPAQTEIGTAAKTLQLRDDERGVHASLVPLPADQGEGFVLRGQSEQFSWDLTVRPAGPVRGGPHSAADAPFSVGHDDDPGLLAGEQWTVDARWPRTRVEGEVTLRATGERYPVAGKGYRENSWGRYLLSADGWDFLVFGAEDDPGLVAVLQTYHRSRALDYLDLAFVDEGQPVRRRFRAQRGELGWQHPAWHWDARSRQCVPALTALVAEDADYRVELRATLLPGSQAPFLYDGALGTRVFFIQEQYPWVQGRVLRRRDGQVVARLRGQAGGEFALHRSLERWRNDEACRRWGIDRYSQPGPQSAVDRD